MILVLALKPVISEKNLDLTVACVIAHKFSNGTPEMVFSVFLRNTETLRFLVLLRNCREQ